MKSHRRELWFNTPTRLVFINDDEPGLLADFTRRLDLGPWEQVFYGEFDGRRKKRVLVKIIGD